MLFSDTCGLVSVAIVYLSYLWISYIGISIGFLSIYSNPEIPVSIFLFLVILSLSSHMVAMFSDPGKITSQATPLRSSGIPCISCNCIKPPRAHHCKTCEKCILNMDHHCPWINNCVGFRNQKHFVLFLTYTFISTVWVIITFLQKIYTCQYQDCFSKDNPFDPLLIMMGCFWCLFFALMTCVSLYEQIKVIKHNISEIDIWQSRKFKQRPLYINLQEVFGCKFGPSWFVPTPIRNGPIDVEVIEDNLFDPLQFSDLNVTDGV